MFYIGILMVVILVGNVLKRYAPVLHVSCISINKVIKNEEIVVLDVRNYNESSYNNIPKVICIPYAYLKRYYHEIPDQPIHLIVRNKVERNLSTRFLRKKGFCIQSYSVSTRISVKR
ncbi:sulfurtransferase [Bacillus cereus]|uniref:sulfurtransferase n=1 Tax=Bacillus cereus TaxID=1396 RepID=UPI00356F2495